MFGIKMNYVVKNSNGGKLAYCPDMKSALECKAKFEKQYATDPFGNSNLKVFIVKL